MTSPEVTVLMSVYNGEQYLHEAMQSILDQTFDDFEFLIIDDASNDNSAAIINSFNDKRIRYLRNDKNLGLTASLNKGLILSDGLYIARMDADDISKPTRLEKQVDFMKANPEVGLLGTWFEYYPTGRKVKSFIEHRDIYAQLFIYNAIAHPTAMLRRSVLIDNKCFYNNKFTKAQDYELWSRLIEITKTANLPEILLLYRVHEGQVSVFSNYEQKIFDAEIKINLYNRLIKNHNNSGFSECLVKLNNSSSKLTNDEFLIIKASFEEAFRNSKNFSSINSEVFLSLHTSLLKKAFDRTQNRSLRLLPSIFKSPFFLHTSSKVKAAYIYKILRDAFSKN